MNLVVDITDDSRSRIHVFLANLATTCYWIFEFKHLVDWLGRSTSHPLPSSRQNSGEPVIAQEIRQQTLENFLAFKAIRKCNSSLIFDMKNHEKLSLAMIINDLIKKSHPKFLWLQSLAFSTLGAIEIEIPKVIKHVHLRRNLFWEEPLFSIWILLRPLSRLIWRSFASDAAIRMLRCRNHLHGNMWFQQPGCTQSVR